MICSIEYVPQINENGEIAKELLERFLPINNGAFTAILATLIVAIVAWGVLAWVRGH